MIAINEQAPAVARASQSIEAEPDVVFSTLADLASWPAWQEAVSSVKADGPATLGTTFRWRSGGVGITSTVELFAPAESLGWRGRSIGTRAIHVWRFRPDGGGTLVETEESMEGWLVTVLRGPMRKVLGQGVSSALASLKVEAERRQAAAGRERVAKEA
jgi:hypothetical protein